MRYQNAQIIIIIFFLIVSCNPSTSENSVGGDTPVDTKNFPEPRILEILENNNVAENIIRDCIKGTVLDNECTQKKLKPILNEKGKESDLFIRNFNKNSITILARFYPGHPTYTFTSLTIQKDKGIFKYRITRTSKFNDKKQEFDITDKLNEKDTIRLGTIMSDPNFNEINPTDYFSRDAIFDGAWSEIEILNIDEYHLFSYYGSFDCGLRPVYPSCELDMKFKNDLCRLYCLLSKIIIENQRSRKKK